MKFSDITYYIFKRYIKLVHDTMLLRKRYVFGIENLPKQGERYFIVGNHQNTGNDPLNILFALPFRIRMCAMARANLFEIRPFITSFLHWVGMVPAYRFGWEGASGLDSNFNSFQQVAERINAGFPFVVFPEAGHTQGQYIGRFTTGTVRIAFSAAELNGWQEDIKILPTALHYSDYFEVQSNIIWMVAQPVSLKPYYEEYQQHPATVMRKLTHQIHDTIQQMMLDEGVEDYETKDFLRLSAFNVQGRSKLEQPELLKRDKAFIARLREHPLYTEIIAKAETLRQTLLRMGTTDQIVAQRPGIFRLLATLLVLLLFLPAWIVCLWPHLLCYRLPLLLLKTDKMFTNTYRYVFSVLIIYPLAALLTLLVSGLGFGLWWPAVLWILLWAPMGKFAWQYYKLFVYFKRVVRYFINKRMIKDVDDLRGQIASLLNN